MNERAVHGQAIELCRAALQMTTAAGAGHPSSATSLAHIVTLLMYQIMRWDPKDPWARHGDRLVLSEGHAVPIIYAAYADLGGVIGHEPSSARPLTPADLDRLREWDSVLDGHPNPAVGFPFFDAATGSLGMGLSVAAGLALAARLDGLDNRIYCLIGDGESREGQIAEAQDFIIDYRLGNVCAVFNCNHQGQAGLVSQQQSAERLTDKLTAYGWRALLIDGHDPREIDSALRSYPSPDRPTAIVARTVKGWGVPLLQHGNHHGKPLPADRLDEALASLDALKVELGVGSAHPELKPAAAQPREPHRGARTAPRKPDFQSGIAAAGLQAAVERGSLATRRAYGAALTALGSIDKRVVALDGDVSNSTFAEIFAEQHGERFFECKIAEQNMVSAAVGLAAGGKIPFVSSFGKFLARAYDQVELAAITRANIKLVGSHCGLGPASDGPSQMALADLAFFAAYARVRDDDGQAVCPILQPADAVAAYRLTFAMADHHGMCYLRTHRPDVPLVYDFDEEFEIGGCKFLMEGPDLTVIATGVTLHEARAACHQLFGDGLRCTLIDAYSLPFDPQTVLQAAGRSAGRILTVEDCYGGGVGTAVAESAAAVGGFTVSQLLVQRLPKSARTPEQLMEHYGLDRAAICRAVRQIVQP